MSSLGRVVVVPRGLLGETAEVQRLALYFDEILTWPMSHVKQTPEMAAEIQVAEDFLREHKLLTRPTALTGHAPISG